MAALFAIGASCLWGTGDFLSGFLAQRGLHPLAITFRLQAMGLVFSLGLIAVVHGEGLTAKETALALLAGLIGGLSLPLFIHAIALGYISVAGPVTGVMNTLVPVVVGLATGDKVTVIAGLGMALAVPAIALLGFSRPLASTPAPNARLSIILAIAAGSGFGLFFVLASIPRQATQLNALPFFRIGGIVASCLAMLWLRRQTGSNPVFSRGLISRRTGGTLAASALADVGGNGSYLLAAQRGSLSIVAPLAGLAPAAMIVLARIFLKDRPSRVQVLGLITALAAIVLLTSG